MSKICSLVVLYKGKGLSQEAHDAICMVLAARGIVQSVDDVQIRYYDGKSIADAILANEHKETKSTRNALHFTVNDNKIQIVKFLKDQFHLSIKEARDVVDAGVIYVNNINYPVILRGLIKVGSRATDLNEDIALQQAVIYINERYPRAYLDKDFISTLIKDVFKAKNSKDDMSIALIESIRLIANASYSECIDLELHESVYNAVCIAYNAYTEILKINH